MEPTIFEKIIAREVSAEIVYEDDETLAFLDIAPNNVGHTLVIPKKLYRNVFDIPEDVWLSLMSTVRKLAPHVRDAVGAGGVNITMNNEHAANQEVFHAHIHIIPRHEGDGVLFFTKTTYQEGEMERVGETIRARLR